MAVLGADFEARLQGLSSDALYEIKKLLRRRCAETQLSAVRVLLSCLRKEQFKGPFPLRKFLLDEDMVGFLCDAMASNSWPLLEQVAAVLDLLLDCDEMLLGGHAVLAAESVQRRAHFLGLMMVATSPECESALRAMLDLLATLMCRWAEMPSRGARGARTVSSLCPPQGLLSTLRLVLDGAGRCSSASASTTLTAVRTLLGLLSVLALDAEPGDPTSLAVRLAACVRAALHALQLLMQTSDVSDGEDTEEDNAKDLAEQACQLMCSFATSVTRIRADCEAMDNDDVTLTLEGLEAEAKKAMLDPCLPFVVRAARTSIEEDLERTVDTVSSTNDQLGQPAMTDELLDALLTSLEMGKDPVALADTLACSDFLWLLPTLHRTNPGSPLALRLLCGVLAHLAHDLLDAGSWWGGGRGGAASLAAFLGSADGLLEADNREWARALDRWPYLGATAATAATVPSEPQALCAPPQAVQLLVLLLFYFRSVAGSDCDPEEIQSIASSLPVYVMSLPNGASVAVPDHVLKMVWLSFAVHCVLASAEVLPGARAASVRLTQLLEQAGARDGLRRAYTHHPALLYWAFQAPAVPPRLQQRLLQLWLEQRGADAAANDAAVMEILAAQRQAVHPMLGVVASGDSRSARVAARLLARAAAVAGSAAAVQSDLHAGLWERLPLELSRGERSAAAVAVNDPAASDAAAAPAPAPAPETEGCGLLVWLAARLDAPISDSLRLRAANLLAGALGKQRLGASPRNLIAALYVLRRELLDSRRRGDSRVLATLLSDERFIQAVLAAANHEDVQLCVKAMQLLRQLEEDHSCLKAAVVPAPVPYELKSVLFAVTCTEPKVVEAGLQLLLEVLKEKPHRFLALLPDDKSSRLLYFTLQNHAIKEMPNLIDAVWSALKGLLPQCEVLPHQPWNHTLIGHTLKLTPIQNLSPQCLAFLLEWLRLVAPEDPPEPTPRRPMPTLLTETASKIASALSEADQGFLQQTAVKDIAISVLGVTANLSPNVEARMKEIAGLQ